jgi:hypothetical protein
MHKLLSAFLSIFATLVFFTDKAHSQTVPFDSSRWEFRADESRIEEHLGRKSLYLKAGFALVKDSKFTDGIIEFDVAFSEERNFIGAVFRWQDFQNHEQFYIRPHQSGNPDANQYQPVFNGVDAWQLYYGERYSAPTKYEFNQWLHIKIAVSRQSADIYIKDMNTPALFVDELKREIKEGPVGLFVASAVPAYFSNFSFTPMTDVRLQGKPKTKQPTPPGTVMSWKVSSPFAEKILDGKYVLSQTDREALTWTTLKCESSGLANLARLQGLKNGNTVFARLTIISDMAQVKRIRFGFSDKVKVYFNNQIVYGGSDVYRSRDYRFLGTIGLFDELYLPLIKGDNELWMAVSETFGGWGIEAEFENMDGIRVKD